MSGLVERVARALEAFDLSCKDEGIVTPDERAGFFQRAATAALEASGIVQAREALERADQFIANGIEFGYIRMPDADTPDSAHETPGIIRQALSALDKQ